MGYPLLLLNTQQGYTDMIFDDYSLPDLVASLEGEVAKCISEIRHAQADLDKAENRQKFILALLHHIKHRYGDI